jgi:E3 ubiquitin-protein ligase RGLG
VKEIVMGGSSSKGSHRKKHVSSYGSSGSSSSSSWNNNDINNNYDGYGYGYAPQSPYPQQSPYHQTPRRQSASAPFYENSQPKKKLDKRYSRIADNYHSLDEVILINYLILILPLHVIVFIFNLLYVRVTV